MTYPANYRQSAVSGESWTRAYEVHLKNVLNSVNSITFFEEEVLAIGDKEFRNKIGTISCDIPPERFSTEFELRDPASGMVVGTATFAQVYLMLYSLYLHFAEQRDAAEAARAAATAPPTETVIESAP